MDDRTQSDILFLTVPSITLWRRYPYIEAPYGPSLVVTGLKKAGFSVSYVDFNVQLNEWQKSGRLLTNGTLSFLCKWQTIPQNYTSLPADLSALLDQFIEFHFAI